MQPKPAMAAYGKMHSVEKYMVSASPVENPYISSSK